MKQIELANGKGIALIDDQDFELVKQYKWHLGKDGYAEAAIRSEDVESGWTTISMHRLIMGLFSGNKNWVDHQNGNPLDNQRMNLRLCDSSRNQANSRIRKDNKSGSRGVWWDYRSRRWIAYITVNKKRFHLGGFDTRDEAAAAYNKAALHHFGEFANLNFI